MNIIVAYLLALNEYNSSLLIGTYGEGLLAINQNNGSVSTLELEPKLPLKFIFSISVFNDNLWIGGIDGPLYHYKNKKLVNNYAVGLVRNLVEGYDNLIYVGSSDGFFEINTRNARIRKIKTAIFNALNEVH